MNNQCYICRGYKEVVVVHSDSGAAVCCRQVQPAATCSTAESRDHYMAMLHLTREISEYTSRGWCTQEIQNTSFDNALTLVV